MSGASGSMSGNSVMNPYGCPAGTPCGTLQQRENAGK
jgi:hypothetical protein